jgi:hypothetical protein
VDGDRYADQKYLDRVPGMFSDVHAIGHQGANVAPWNLEGLEVRKQQDRLTVNGQQLLFFHFHALRSMFYRFYDSGLSAYGVAITPEVRKLIYRPYLAALAKSERILSGLPTQQRQDLPRRPPTRLRELVSFIRQSRRQIDNGVQVVW